MTGVIAVLPTQQFNFNGEPVAAGTLEVFLANTVTHSDSWQDYAQTTLNTNPIVLDAQGGCNLWLQPSQVYDLVLRDGTGTTLRTYQDVSGAFAAQTVVATEWISTGLAPTYVSASTFTLVGDQTGSYQVGRRVRATVSGGLKYSTIISSVFSTVTTITVLSALLDASLSLVDIGFVSAVDNSAPASTLLNMTGYSGADIALVLRQSAYQDVTSATSILLRIATATDQIYRVRVVADYAAGLAGASSTLQMNNTTLAGTPITYELVLGTQAAASAATGSSNAWALDFGGVVHKLNFEVCTRTTAKTVSSEGRSSNATSNFLAIISQKCSDTTTAWTSLGTMAVANGVTGRILVTRVM
jgi:hypothetical protein